MRMCAQAVGGVESKLTGRRGEFSQEERGYFNKVFVHLYGQFGHTLGFRPLTQKL